MEIKKIEIVREEELLFRIKERKPLARESRARTLTPGDVKKPEMEVGNRTIMHNFGGF